MNGKAIHGRTNYYAGLYMWMIGFCLVMRWIPMNVDHSVCQRTAAVDPTPAYFKSAKQYRKILKKKKGLHNL
jgi:hypothetical protein